MERRGQAWLSLAAGALYSLCSTGPGRRPGQPPQRQDDNERRCRRSSVALPEDSQPTQAQPEDHGSLGEAPPLGLREPHQLRLGVPEDTRQSSVMSNDSEQTAVGTAAAQREIEPSQDSRIGSDIDSGECSG